MRTHVTFRHPAEFVPLSEEDGILAAWAAQWFAELLRQVPGLQIEDLCQEDWGVVFFARRHERKFWIGLSSWDEGSWLAHFHHGLFAWFARFSSSRKAELRGLMMDFHKVLTNEPAITDIAWHEESEMSKPRPAGF